MEFELRDSIITVTTPEFESTMTEAVTFDDILKIIDENEYVKNCVSNQSSSIHSLSYLISGDRSQSDRIKCGNAVEKILRDMATKLTACKVVPRKNKKGLKEKDILLMDNTNKKIYYAEIKCNLDLDTEKSRSTFEKCQSIRDELTSIIESEDKLSGYTLEWCLLGARYLHFDDIPHTIAKKYVDIEGNVFGVNQFLEMVGVPFQYTMDQYVGQLNYMAEAMFDR